MNKKLCLAFALFSLACGAKDSSVSGVFPANGFLDKSVEVLITGSNTDWGRAVGISFGAGITVEAAEVASPTAIMATITIAGDAPIGPRDVVVDGETLAGVFTVESPIEVQVSGTQAQGSIIFLEVRNLDFDRPFDTTQTGDGLFSPIAYTNFSGELGQGTNLQISDVQPYSASLVATVDVFAPEGAKALTLRSGPEDSSETFTLPVAATIEARTAQAIKAGSPVTTTQEQPQGSGLYSVSLADLAIMTAQVGVTSEVAAPNMILLSENGTFFEIIDQGADLALTASGNFYLIYIDGSNASSYDYQISVNAVTPNMVSEGSEDNDTAEAATILELPTFFSARFAAAEDEDWFSVQVDEGEVLRVMTAPGAQAADPIVLLYSADDPEFPIAASDDDGYHERFVSEPLDAGTYLIQIRWSPDYLDAFTPADSEYAAAFWLQ